jgi:hypothetical protein
MAARALNTIAAANPGIATSWQNSRETFTDLPPTHLNYPAASRAVSAGVLPKLENDAFQWTRTVSGAEAVKAVERLEALARARRR